MVPLSTTVLRVYFSKLLLPCLNLSINTQDCSHNNARHNHKFCFLHWL